jgi:hypothetical protein
MDLYDGFPQSVLNLRLRRPKPKRSHLPGNVVVNQNDIDGLKQIEFKESAGDTPWVIVGILSSNIIEIHCVDTINPFRALADTPTSDPRPYISTPTPRP